MNPSTIAALPADAGKPTGPAAWVSMHRTVPHGGEGSGQALFHDRPGIGRDGPRDRIRIDRIAGPDCNHLIRLPDYKQTMDRVDMLGTAIDLTWAAPPPLATS